MPAKFDHRTFVRIDDGYPEHPKVLPLSDAAFRAHVESICWCSRQDGRTNGRIPKAVARKKFRAKAITELVKARLLEDAGDDYEVHDYLDFNRSGEEVAAFRESRGDAGTLGNHKRWHVARRRWDKDCKHCQEENRIGIAK